jgi:hypothetical protein
MKSNRVAKDPDEMREEYDFENMPGGVRGRYAKAFEGNATVVLLASDVAEIFPDSESVNDALRTLTRVLRKTERNA